MRNYTCISTVPNIFMVGCLIVEDGEDTVALVFHYVLYQEGRLGISDITPPLLSLAFQPQGALPRGKEPHVAIR
jgi:hypothetical protein